MNKNQIIKILKVAIISTLIIFIFECIFSIPFINEWFSKMVIFSGNYAYLVIWLIMFLQVTILNIPAYVILSASIAIGMNTLSFEYIFVVLSAYMCGCLLAYFLGYKFGKKAVHWCAGSDEDYDKWCKFIDKKGRFWYFLTVLFPFFPDDLLCLACGSVKMDFLFYSIANLIGRGIGLVAMLLTLKLLGSFGTNFPYMIIVWAVLLISEIIILKVIQRKPDNWTLKK